MFTRSGVRAQKFKSRTPWRQGFTLLEVLVSAFLGALVLYVLITLLIPAMRMSALGTTRVDLDQRATLLEQRLIRSLKSTNRAGVMTASHEGGVLLTTHPIEGSLTGSKQKWADYLVLFSWENKQLTESRTALEEPPIKATTIPLEGLLEVLGSKSVRFLVDDVDSFKAEMAQGPQVDFSFTLKSGDERLEVHRTVFLVNSSQ